MTICLFDLYQPSNVEKGPTIYWPSLQPVSSKDASPINGFPETANLRLREMCQGWENLHRIIFYLSLPHPFTRTLFHSLLQTNLIVLLQVLKTTTFCSIHPLYDYKLTANRQIKTHSCLIYFLNIYNYWNMILALFCFSSDKIIFDKTACSNEIYYEVFSALSQMRSSVVRHWNLWFK